MYDYHDWARLGTARHDRNDSVSRMSHTITAQFIHDNDTIYTQLHTIKFGSNGLWERHKRKAGSRSSARHVRVGEHGKQGRLKTK